MLLRWPAAAAVYQTYAGCQTTIRRCIFHRGPVLRVSAWHRVHGMNLTIVAAFPAHADAYLVGWSDIMRCWQQGHASPQQALLEALMSGQPLQQQHPFPHLQPIFPQPISYMPVLGLVCHLPLPSIGPNIRITRGIVWSYICSCSCCTCCTNHAASNLA